MGLPRDETRILYLFPDTNLFIQCRPIEELPWSDLGDFDYIRLIVCRPVMREIDNQKTRGNDRVGHRARSTYKLFRGIIKSDLDYRVIIEGKPTVEIFLEASLPPPPELKDRLDYEKPDDAIVGCLHQFSHENQNKDVRLLTHDGGPMMTAKSLSLPFVPIDDIWLLKPENSQGERELARLKDRVAQLERAEPQVRLTCVNEQGEELQSLNVDHFVYSRLTEADVAALLQSLKGRFPPAEDFGSRERRIRLPSGVVAKALGATETYTPASDEAIAHYLNEAYPEWLTECESTFLALHSTLQREIRLPFLTFVANNCGTRPAKDVLLQFEAKGDVWVSVPLGEDENNGEEGTVTSSRLPSPPRPPHGEWKSAPSSVSLLGAHIPAVSSFLTDNLGHPPFITRPGLALPVGASAQRLDPNEFYYKPSRPMEPVESFSLQCEQWRHDIGDHKYLVTLTQVSANLSEDNVKGAIECSIHAENLSAPHRLIIPVRITIKRVSARNHAERLIEDLQS